MASTDTAPIRGLDHVTLAVAALDEAVAAYETLFAEPCAGRGQENGLAWARFDLANTRLVLVHGAGGLPEAGARARLAALGFAVEDPDGAARLLARRGLPTDGPAQSWLGRPALRLAPEPARGLPLRLVRTEASATPASAIRLDHLVIQSGDPEGTLALLGGRLGLDLRLDRSNPEWGTRLLFFRCGDLVLEVSHALEKGITECPDRLWGITWRVPDLAACHARLEAAGVPVSPLRIGRKPGTRIFTVREQAAGVPTAFIGR